MKNQAIQLLIIEEIPGNWLALQKESQSGPFPFTVTQASNIDEARFKFNQKDFEVVVADYFLKDGVCTDLIPDLNGTPLIVMTREGSEDIALLALKTGACDYLIKDKRRNYLKLLPLTVSKSLEQKNQADELDKYRTQLENIVEELSHLHF
jgi:DNA-binding NtrC family response regulator